MHHMGKWARERGKRHIARDVTVTEIVYIQPSNVYSPAVWCYSMDEHITLAASYLARALLWSSETERKNLIKN